MFFLFQNDRNYPSYGWNDVKMDAYISCRQTKQQHSSQNRYIHTERKLTGVNIQLVKNGMLLNKLGDLSSLQPFDFSSRRVAVVGFPPSGYEAVLN